MAASATFQFVKCEVEDEMHNHQDNVDSSNNVGDGFFGKSEDITQEDSWTIKGEEVENMQTKRTTKSIPKLSCDLCPYEAPRLIRLKQHVNIKHKGLKYNCNLCSFEATETSNLKRHMMNKHGETSVKSYKCELCNSKATIHFHC